MQKHSAKLVYVAALPYSGSTVFSIALGNSQRFLNIGEAKFIENDWNDSSLCYCQKPLSKCSFWVRFMRARDITSDDSESAIRLDNRSTLRDLDSRRLPFVKMLLADIGIPLPLVFGARTVNEYVGGTTELVNCLTQEFEPAFIVDASKSLRRLKALRHHSGLEVKVIVLHRRLHDLLASRLKRARLRNPSYSPLLSPIYLMWVCLRKARMKWMARRLRPEDCLEINYEEFCDTPKSLERKISAWLGASVDFGIDDEGVINTDDCHIFTGNVGVTKRHGRENGIPLRRTRASLKECTLIERVVLGIARK